MNENPLKNKRKPIVGIVAAVVIIAVAVPYAMYFSWTARKDNIDFSAKPQYGWGTVPITASVKGATVHLYDEHNFLFVRDIQYDSKTQSMFASGELTAPGP